MSGVWDYRGEWFTWRRCGARIPASIDERVYASTQRVKAAVESRIRVEIRLSFADRRPPDEL